MLRAATGISHLIMEALLILLPKTEGQPRIYRRNRSVIDRSSVASPLASPLASYLALYLASYLASPVDRNRNAAYSQQFESGGSSDGDSYLHFHPERSHALRQSPVTGSPSQPLPTFSAIHSRSSPSRCAP